jgi:hypothetical protein
MWFFSQKRRMARRIRAAFSEFIPEDTLSQIIENPKEVEVSPLQKEYIRYLIFQVRDETVEECQRNLGSALDIVLDAGGIVEDITSSVVVVIFQMGANQPKLSLAELSSKLGPNVRAVFGQGEHWRGTVGSKRRFTYGTVFSGYARILEALLQ